MASEKKGKSRKGTSHKALPFQNVDTCLTCASRKVATSVPDPSESMEPKPSKRSTRQPAKENSESAKDAVDTSPNTRQTRKRASDFFAEEDTSKADKSTNSKPTKKAKIVKDTETKPSKIDGHPIQTEKSAPGGDSVEVEPPRKKASPEKNRVAEAEAEVGSGLVVSPPSSKTKSKASQKKSASKAVGDDDKAQEGESTQQLSKPNRSGKPSKARAKKGGTEPADVSPGANPAPFVEEPANVKEKPDKPSKTKAASKSGRSKGRAEAADLTKQEDATTKPMDEGPFETLLENITPSIKATPTFTEPAMPQQAEKRSSKKDKSKAPSSKTKKSEEELVKDAAATAPAVSKKTGKATEKATDVDDGPAKSTGRSRKAAAPMSPSSDDPKPVDGLGGSAHVAKGANASEEKKSKKRKAPTDAVAAVDVQPEPAILKKAKKGKAKKDDSAGGKSTSILSSGIDAVTKGALAAKDYLEGLADSIPKAIADDVEGVAEGAVEAKDQVDDGVITPKQSQHKGRASKPVATSGESKKAPTDDTNDSVDYDNGSEEEDDQTIALLKGFDESDEEDKADDDFEAGASMPQIPDTDETQRKLRGVKDVDEAPGVVYIGRIPHGFYENEMRSYFSQFGTVNRIRLSHNRKTGKSKHYAFIEFLSAGVAKIVADTMNNYLMFGHILKCNVVPREQVHDNLWKGANKRFKAVPWAKIEGRKLSEAVTEQQWSKRIEKEEAKRKKKLEQVKTFGYEFDVGKIKDISEISALEIRKRKAVEAADQDQLETVQEQSTVTVDYAEGGNVMVVSKEIKTKKSRKSKEKGKGVEENAVKTAVEPTIEPANTSIPVVDMVRDEIIEDAVKMKDGIAEAVGLKAGSSKRGRKKNAKTAKSSKSDVVTAPKEEERRTSKRAKKAAT
ncbi:hypothetical protein MMC25_005405 [Agyrium rufum]|nr:hypothetical protein [Agyrium rufum]